MDRRTWQDWNILGIALLNEGNFADARVAFERVIRLSGAYADGRTNVAIAELDLNQFDAAQADASEALDLARAAGDQRAIARALYYRGLIERNQEDALAGSVRDLQAVAQLYPEPRQVLHQLGVSEYLVGTAEAQRTFAALLAKSPYDLLGHYYLAVLERRAGLSTSSAGQAAPT